MASPFDRVEAALLPADGLAALSSVRVRDGVSVIKTGTKIWATWPAGTEQVWQLLLSVPSTEFFELRDGRWYQLGHSLPRFDLPPYGESGRLDTLLLPSPLKPALASEIKISPMALRLVPSDRLQPTAALRVDISNLLPWVERAPSAELAACRAARFGKRLVLRGEKLPALTDAERFWGNRVWLPLGFRAEPDLPETALRAAADMSLGEILLITDSGPEAIPEDAFRPLSRAAARILASQS